MNDNEEKSSRAAADYFELLICQSLADHFYTGDNFDGLLAELKEKVFIQNGGPQKIIDQVMRAALSIDITTAAIEKFQSDHGPVKKITWVGRELAKSQSKEDVLISFEDAWLLGLSVKSVASGSGTLDNAGRDMSKEYFGFDVTPEMDLLKQVLHQIIVEKKIGEQAEKAGFSQFHNLKYQFPELVAIGRDLGLIIQKKATEASVVGFNSLPEEKKRELVQKMLGLGSPLKMLFLLASGKKVSIKEDSDFLSQTEGTLTAVVKTSKKFQICSDGKPLIGVQSAFTNGTGLSSFCQRAFIDRKQVF